MKTEKILNLLHLARKAGKLQFGFDACERSCLQNRAKILIIATDLSENTKKKVLYTGRSL